MPVVQEQQLLAAELAPITPREQTAALSAALGAPLRFVEVTREQAAAAMRAFAASFAVWAERNAGAFR